MTGKENRVQKIICDKYSKATFFHCASHRINLVVNDLNAVTKIQNTVGVIIEVINFLSNFISKCMFHNSKSVNQGWTHANSRVMRFQ
jgi:hypothetical protein